MGVKALAFDGVPARGVLAEAVRRRECLRALALCTALGAALISRCYRKNRPQRAAR